MYLYYLIGWKLDANQEMEISGVSQKLEKEKCFILALDGDVDFDPPALDSVLNRMKRNDHVAACCGQIHPKVHKIHVFFFKVNLNFRGQAGWCYTKSLNTPSVIGFKKLPNMYWVIFNSH